ncbi:MULTISPECIES: flagellar protein FlaG [unclassified Pseudoalteromonas]|uniref:flagellar protein FlaG n=1 Tax=unclassified Pseudoalteromonas TaxID=194690 RepID=UPI0005A5D242|nr:MULTISPECIES: flagellar protein FlaG [unclassified Pseudoalteromonas]
MDSFNVDINSNLNFSTKAKNEQHNNSDTVGLSKEVQNTKLALTDIDTSTKETNESTIIKEQPTELVNLDELAQKLQDFADETNTSLEFLVDQDSGRNVIKVIDKTSGDIVKQYPTEEVLSIVAKLSEAPGAFINFEV